MKSKILKLDIISLMIGVLGSLIFFMIWPGNIQFIKTLAKHEGIFENLTALFYLFGFIICIYRLIKSSKRNKILLFFWALFCFFCLGEEISWFQRIFNYSVPAVEEINKQHEFNIHNLKLVEPASWLDTISSGKFSLRLFLGSQNMFNLGFLIYFLIIPLLMYAGKLKFIKSKLNFTIPSIYFFISVWVTILFSVILAIFGTHEVHPKIAETREMFFAIFISVYIYGYLRL
jgi:hypothetical protein